jgi:hypothetical protein
LSFPKQKFKENFLNFDYWQSVSTNLQSLLNSDEAINPKKKVEKSVIKKENVITMLKFMYRDYRQSGWLCTRWGEIAQSLNFKYLFKKHCKSNELLWVLYNMVPLKSPQQFVGFAVFLEKIFKV